MKSEVFNAHNKYRILKHAMKEKNVSRTCEIFGISRATFYNWNRAYLKYGMNGLELKEPKSPTMPNKVSREIENAILSYVTKFPTDGPKRIYYELKSEGLSVGETGIYNVLKRSGLTTQTKRIAFSNHSIKTVDFETTKAKIKTMQNTVLSEKSTYPGHHVIQRIDYMGTFEGIGKIYQYSVVDTFSRWGIVKLYNRKKDIDIWDYFEVKLVYLMKIFNLSIDQLLTIKSKPFVPFFVNGDKYQEILDGFKIDHQFISQDQIEHLSSPSSNPSTNHGKVEAIEALDAFNRLLLKGFYEKIGSEVNYDSFAQVERAMNKFVRQTNFSISISSGINSGKKPAEVVLDHAKANNVDLDTLPLWLMAVINAPRPTSLDIVARDSVAHDNVASDNIDHEQGNLYEEK